MQRVVEMKAVAEQLHFKISTLLLHSGKETEAVRWFREHASWYKQMLGPLEGAFLHWAWVSKQFQVFAELLHTSLATASQAPSPSATLQSAVSDRELQPAYYYHVSSVLKIKLASCYCYLSYGRHLQFLQPYSLTISFCMGVSSVLCRPACIDSVKCMLGDLADSCSLYGTKKTGL